jgi:putative glycerol-1-phosphate prenyltransferase
VAQASSVLQSFTARKQRGDKGFALLIDPDKTDARHTRLLAQHATAAGADYIFVGGSFVSADTIREVVHTVKQHTALPVVLFPGTVQQLVAEADAVLLLSLISGRNPELLIGTHVHAAPVLENMQAQSGLQILATGYMLVETGRLTTAAYMSGTLPLPANKPDVAAYTALAGQYLGMQLLYADAGSGADAPIPTALIGAIAAKTNIPLIVGGGIRTVEAAQAALQAGADVFVVGTALEGNPTEAQIAERLFDFASVAKTFKRIEI